MHRIPKLHRRGSSRAGFTLTELLVVIAIIGVLAAITAGILTQVVVTSEQKGDEKLITSLDSELQKHWKAVIDQANDDPIQDGILLWAGGDVDRARVIMRFLYLRNEFPQDYIEALTPVKIPLNTVPSPPSMQPNTDLPANVQLLLQQHPANPGNWPQPPQMPAAANGAWPTAVPANPYIYPYTYPYPFQTYQTVLQNQGVTFALRKQPLYQLALAGVTLYTFPRDWESSAVFLLALQKPRRGTGGLFNPEETLVKGSLKDTNGDGVLKIVDSHAVPIGFWRTPTANPDLQADPTLVAPLSKNLLDPQGKLVDPVWNNKQNMLSVYLFEDLTGIEIHEQRPRRNLFVMPNVPPPGSNQPLWAPVNVAPNLFSPSYASVPVIGTAGRDQAWGVFWGSMLQPGAPLARNLVRPAFAWTLNPAAADDNIYNYRLKQ